MRDLFVRNNASVLGVRAHPWRSMTPFTAFKSMTDDAVWYTRHKNIENEVLLPAMATSEVPAKRTHLLDFVVCFVTLRVTGTCSCMHAGPTHRGGMVGSCCLYLNSNGLTVVTTVTEGSTCPDCSLGVNGQVWLSPRKFRGNVS